MSNFDDLKLSVEALSGGKNTVLFDDKGMPSIYVVIPKGKISDVIEGGSQNVHPAFFVNSVELNNFYFSKYANIIMNDRAYSLPFKDPATGMDFDRAIAVCENKGPGFHLATVAEWGYIANWSKKNQTVPRGNNNYGSDYSAPHEKGVCTYMADATHIGRVATGSGPATWSHDWTNEGIFDMNGNISNWLGGMRLMGGKIQIIPYNNAAAHVSQSATSTLWKEILPDGTLVEPGTAGTLTYDCEAANGTGIRINTEIEFSTEANANKYTSKALYSVTAKDGVNIPEILKALLLAPTSAVNHGTLWVVNKVGSETLPIRGGHWTNTSYAGVDYMYLNGGRSISYGSLGLFSAFC